MRLEKGSPMKKKLSVYAAAAIAITAVILILPEKCLQLSLNGLTLWFSKMIPALFPFMVLSGIMIRMKLVDPCVKFLMPVLGRLFNVGSGCVYGMVVGFLCGFPMGAHTAAQLYENKMISKREASFLLAFCNNIGPVYFLSFALPMALPASGMDFWGIYFFGMYGLPFFYGLFLRYVFFRDITPCSYAGKGTDSPGLSLLGALDQSLEGALFNIARLGGYMVVFNLLFIFPILLAGILPLPGPAGQIFIGGAGCLLEITGGIGLLGKIAPYLVLCVLPFGGLSCIAQTAGMIRNTDLSIMEYVMHKMILTAITVFFYLLAANRFFLP